MGAAAAWAGWATHALAGLGLQGWELAKGRARTAGQGGLLVRELGQGGKVGPAGLGAFARRERRRGSGPAGGLGPKGRGRPFPFLLKGFGPNYELISPTIKH